MKVILLNAPPRAGKDTGGDAILSFFGGEKLKFSDPLKDGTHTAWGLSVATDHFESRKDEPADEFGGITPRKAYIDHAEEYMKRLYGHDVYGKILARRITEYPQGTLIVVPDSGFAAEAAPVVERVGAENVLLIRIFRDGKDFSNDSRSYISLPGVQAVEIVNNGDIEVFRYGCAGHAAAWAGLKQPRFIPEGGLIKSFDLLGGLDGFGTRRMLHR